ncbi:MAG: hypothetical protein WBD27_00145 [Pyrinomonadaceae bacterium]
MGNGSGAAGDCTGSLCGYGITKGRIGCQSGDGSCWAASLVDAKLSPFYTQELKNATRQIKSILDSINSPGDGLKLSFVHTRLGTLLAWVNHGEQYTTETVTWADTDENIVQALGLILDEEQTAESY